MTSSFVETCSEANWISNLSEGSFDMLRRIIDLLFAQKPHEKDAERMGSFRIHPVEQRSRKIVKSQLAKITMNHTDIRV